MTKEFRNRKNETLLQNTTLKENVVMVNCYKCTLDNVKFDGSKSPEGEKLLHAKDCQECNFNKVEFFGKKTGGLCFNLTGAKSESNNLIDCYWHDIESTAKNGAEPLRLGNSNLSHCWLRTNVVRPRFKNIKTKEPEIISVKSNGNVIDGGADQDPNIINVENCTSAFTVRHGHTTTMRNLRFKGIGGIRLYGKNNTLDNIECFDNKDGHFIPVRIMNGDVLEDPNEAAGKKPGEDGEGHATHAQTKNNKLVNIKLVNCTHGLWFGVDSGKYKPVGTRVQGLNVVNTDGKGSIAVEFSDSATTKGNFFDDCFYEGKVTIPESNKPSFTKGKPETPDPIVVPDTEEHQGPTKHDEEDDEVPPLGPEPAPIVEPAEEKPKHDHTCQICGKENAKGRMSVYSCVEDMTEEIIREFNMAWAIVEGKIKSGEIKIPKQLEE